MALNETSSLLVVILRATHRFETPKVTEEILRPTTLLYAIAALNRKKRLMC